MEKLVKIKIELYFIFCCFYTTQMSSNIILNRDITVPKYFGTSHLLYANFKVIHEANVGGINRYCIVIHVQARVAKVIAPSFR